MFLSGNSFITKKKQTIHVQIKNKRLVAALGDMTAMRLVRLLQTSMVKQNNKIVQLHLNKKQIFFMYAVSTNFLSISSYVSGVIDINQTDNL